MSFTRNAISCDALGEPRTGHFLSQFYLLQFDQMTWVVLFCIIILPIEIDQICVGDLGIAARGPAFPVSVELVVVAAAAAIDKPAAALGHWVVMVHRHSSPAMSSLWGHPADVAAYHADVDPGLKNLMF